MNLMFYVAVYISSIFSSVKHRHMDKLAVKINENFLDLKFTEDNHSITATMKIKDYFPLGPAIWYHENKKIGATTDSIDGVNRYEWEHKFLIGSDKTAGFNKLFEEYPNKIVEFKFDKVQFDNRKGYLEFELCLAKIDIYKKYFIESIEKIKSHDYSNNEASEEYLKSEEEKFKSMTTTPFVFRFYIISEGFIDFKNYDIVAFKHKVNDDEIFHVSKLLLKCATDVTINMLGTVGVFGFLIFAGRYSLSKYF